MSEEQKKSRRRRRRTRPASKNKSRPPKSSTKSASSKPSSSERKSSSGSGRRSRGRRRNSGAANKQPKQGQQGTLAVQQHTEKDISPVNKDIFIYTYTLRPRSLLDSYEAGPSVAEKMTFEQPDQQHLDD